MRDTFRAVAVGMLAAGLSTATAVILAAPVIMGLAQAVHSGQAATGQVGAWSDRASLVLTGRMDLILRLVRCPIIENGL